jgi:DNA replication and repair protein RecF
LDIFTDAALASINEGAKIIQKMSHRLKRLGVTGFRLFDSSHIDTDASLVCFHGLNGAGKTSLLEAIHYLCLGKGYFSQTDQQNIGFGGSFFRIEGEFASDSGSHKVVCALESGKRKVVSLDGVRYDRLSQHLSRFPAIVIAPDDIAIVKGGGEYRRRLVDNVLCQVSPDYTEHLSMYNRSLQQRDAALRALTPGRRQVELVTSYDPQLITSGTRIFELRTSHLSELIQIFQRLHTQLSNSEDKARCEYASELNGADMRALLERSLESDLATQRTSHGVHRDDLTLSLNDRPIRRFGSQGQVKTMLVALKLASFLFLKERLGKTPLLLLDDLFDRLDEPRGIAALDFATGGACEQVFITETDPERLKRHLGDHPKSLIFVEVVNGHAG